MKEHKGTASAFPVHSGTGEPAGLLGLILRPRSLPPAAQSPSLAPAPPARAPSLHSETPSNALGLNPPTPHPHLRALPPNSGTPHSRGPPLHLLPLPFCKGPKQRPRPTLERHHPPGPTPPKTPPIPKFHTPA